MSLRSCGSPRYDGEQVILKRVCPGSADACNPTITKRTAVSEATVEVRQRCPKRRTASHGYSCRWSFWSVHFHRDIGRGVRTGGALAGWRAGFW